MKTRSCGPDGPVLPVLGVAFGGGACWGLQDQPAVDAVVDRTPDLGITCFDTAERGKAGASEESLGRALRTSCDRHYCSCRPHSRHGEPRFETETRTALEAVRAIARDEQIPLPDLALASAVANPDITCVLAGSRNISQLEENVGAISLHLSPATIERLNAITEELLRRLGHNPDYDQGLAHPQVW